MRDNRPYKKPYGASRIIEELTINSGKMYDPMVVAAFLKVLQSEGLAMSSSEGGSGTPIK
jgi:HD-GYP domain-containing protein (c-di-GMP phosphodiesterase class II)